MSEYRETLDRIRNYEQQVSFAKMTNEKELPKLKENLERIVTLEFHNSDKDLLARLLKIKDTVDKMDSDGISREVLESLKTENSAIGAEIVRRYKERMDRHASRQSSF